jgi:hypothetical protein
MEPPFEALFNEFRTLPPAVRRSPTFMEVAGYPHYENVCSNILAFYFDPSNPHGFGNLLLDTFAEGGQLMASQRGRTPTSLSNESRPQTQAIASIS